MAFALHPAGARWALLALLIFIIGALHRFSYLDSIYLSDLKNFRQSSSETGEPNYSHSDGGLEDIQNSTLGVRTPRDLAR